MTRLTMPRAGTDPGPAARAVPQPASELGAAVGELGEVANSIGTAIINDKMDREMRRAQVDLTRDINDLRLEIEQVGDPDEAEARWSEGVQALKQSYVAPGDDGTARISQRNAERFGLAFDDLANRHAYQIGAQNLERRRSERMATYRAYQFEAERAATGTDAETRDVLAMTGEEQIEGMLAAGILTAEEAEIERQTLRQNLDRTAAFETYNSDPELFLQEMESGAYEFLDPQVASRMKAGAKSDIAASEEKAKKKLEAEQKAEVKAIGDNLDRISSLSNTTRLSAEDRAFLEGPAVSDLAASDPDLGLKLRKAQARVSLDEEEGVFARMSPPQLRAAIADERARKVKHPYQEERLAILEETLAYVEDKTENDALSHAASIGIPISELPFDQGPEAFEAGLAKRVETARDLLDQGYAADFQVMTPQERTQLKPALAREADPAERFTVINGMARQLGREADQVIMRATGDRVTAHAATLVANGAPREQVEALLEAQKRLADKTVTAPSPAEWREAFTGAGGGMFISQPETLARLQGTALALYAQENPLGDSTTIDASGARLALDRALGGDGAGRGGLMKVDDYNLPLPPGMPHRAVLDMLDALPVKMGRRVQLDAQGEATGKMLPSDMSGLQAASLRGALPDFKDNSPAREIEGMTLAPLWPDGRPVDQYVFFNDVGAPLLDTNGKVFVFSLRRLVRETVQ